MTIKNQVNNQFGRVSSSGVLPASQQLTDNEGTEPLLDQNKRQWVNFPPDAIINVNSGYLTPGGFYKTLTNTNAKLITGSLISLGPCVLSGLRGFVEGMLFPPPGFIQLYNFSDHFPPISPPDDPIIIIPVTADYVEIIYDTPYYFNTGLTIAWSSTSLVYTAPPSGYLVFETAFYTP